MATKLKRAHLKRCDRREHNNASTLVVKKSKHVNKQH